MKNYDKYEEQEFLYKCDRAYIEDLLDEKDRLLDVARRDMESLKREIVSLKKQLNYSKSKKK